MGYKMQSGSLDDLRKQMALLDHVKDRASADLLAGGQGGRWRDQQQEKAKADSAAKLDAYIKMSKAYPGMKPPQQVQNAGNTMMASPMEQIGSNFGMQPQGNYMPNMAPAEAQRQNKGVDAMADMNTKFETANAMADKLGITDMQQRKEFIMNQVSQKKTGGMTDYQTSRQRNSTDAVLSAIAQGKGIDDLTGRPVDLTSPEDAYAFISRAAMKDSNINVKDPRFKQAVEQLFAVQKPVQKGPGFMEKAGKFIGDAAKAQSPAYQAVQAINKMIKDRQPTSTKQAMAELLGNAPGLSEWYKDARRKGASDDVLFKFIMDKHNPGQSNGE